MWAERDEWSDLICFQHEQLNARNSYEKFSFNDVWLIMILHIELLKFERL